LEIKEKQITHCCLFIARPCARLEVLTMLTG
jgi:hypothetical protein